MPIVILHIDRDHLDASRLAERISQNGFDVWSVSDLLVGQALFAELEQRLDPSGIVLVYGTCAAAGTRWIRDAINGMRGMQRKIAILVAKIEAQADLEWLGAGTQVADFSANQPLAFAKLRAALTSLTSTRTTQRTVAQLREALRQGNRSRLDAFVGDKYREELYVSRAPERFIDDFSTDPRVLAERVASLLETILQSTHTSSGLKGISAKILKRFDSPSATERDAIVAALTACKSGLAVADPSVFISLVSAVEPPGYKALRAEFESLSAYVTTRAADLSVLRLREYDHKIGKLIAGPAHAEMHDLRLRIWATLTRLERRRVADGPSEDKLVENEHYCRVARRFRVTSLRTADSKEYRNAVRALERFERALTGWAHERVLAFSKSQATDRLEPIRTADVVRRCNNIVDAARRCCLVIVDAAGSGKTNMLSDIAVRTTGTCPTLVLYAKALEQRRHSLGHALDEIALAIGCSSFQELLAVSDNELDVMRAYTVVLIDGINECADDVTVADSLRLLVASHKNARVRFVVTCRDIYWRYFEDALSGPEYRIVSGHLRRYSDSEFREALSKYLKAYGLSQTKIEADALEAFRSPILLRFFCEAYGAASGKSPGAPARVTGISLKRLFDDYLRAKLQRLVELGHTKRGYGPMREKATLEQMMLRVAAAMMTQQTPILPRGALAQVLGDADLDSRGAVYQRLLDEDIILEEKDGEVVFVYEAFMEYAIARSLLRRPSEKTAQEVLESMIAGTAHFRNMRGAVLMALVILAEDWRVSSMEMVLSSGDEWRPIVLEAIHQLSPSHVTVDATNALQRIAEDGTLEEQREALHLLFCRTGQLGRSAGLTTLREASGRLLNEALEIVGADADAALVSDLVSETRAGHKHAAAALLRVSPSRRAVDHLITSLAGADGDLAALILRVLSNAAPGDHRRVADVAKTMQRHPHSAVVAAAEACAYRIEGRQSSSESDRRSRISRSRRSRRGQRAKN